MLLVHETVDQAAQPRTAWTFNPASGRCASPRTSRTTIPARFRGLRTNDDFGVFNGATDRYDWKLVGRSEMYVPYNSYRYPGGPQVRRAPEAGHLNQDSARYELHASGWWKRRSRPAAPHVYARRVFYIDEDSWQILASDKYDAKGALWRYSEQHSEVWYDIPALMGTIEVHNDLQAAATSRWASGAKRSSIYEPIKRSAGDYNPASCAGRALGGCRPRLRPARPPRGDRGWIGWRTR
jgi:hypothetical protein